MVKKRIKLIVTGDGEREALHKSLGKALPTQNSAGDEVVWDVPRKINGATSYQLKEGSPPSQSMRDMANAMFAEVLQGKAPREAPPDLVVVIDDVELGNVDQERIVVEAFRAAVREKLGQIESTTSAANFQRIKLRIRECCSFHLLRPMIESYFFSSPDFLLRCIPNIAHPPALTHPTDVECFDAGDDPNEIWQEIYSRENSEKQRTCSWWKTEQHPKRYLAHLLAINGFGKFQETTHGAQMIEDINWAKVAKVGSDAPIISALLEDLWQWFGENPPAGTFAGAASPWLYCIKTVRPQEMVLRNI